MGDDWHDFDTFHISWVPIVSGIAIVLTIVTFITILVCNFCAGCALYNRRRELQLTGVTTVTHTGYGRSLWNRNQVIIVQQGYQPAQQPYGLQQPPPPPYNPNTAYPAGFVPTQDQGQSHPNPDYPLASAPAQGQGQSYPHPPYPPVSAPTQVQDQSYPQSAYPSSQGTTQGYSQPYPVQPGGPQFSAWKQ